MNGDLTDLLYSLLLPVPGNGTPNGMQEWEAEVSGKLIDD
jgi:hypothetical protein